MDPLTALWQAPDAPPALSPAAIRSLKADAARLGRALAWRDAREVAAVLAGAAWFGSVAAADAAQRGPALGLVAGCLWVAAVLVAVRVRFRRPGPALPPRAAAVAEHAWLSAQVRLLHWAGLWYVAPLGGAVAAFELAGRNPSAFYLVALCGLSAGLVWLNRRAAEALVPARDAFSDLLHSFDSPPP